MNDDFRLRIAAGYLLLMVIGLMAIMLPMWARTLGVLGAVTGTLGLVWACWGGDILGQVFRRMKRDRRLDAKPEPGRAADGAGVHPPGDKWIVVGVPCEPEIYDEMRRAVAEGWRLTEVPGHAETVSAAEDPRIAIDGPHGYRTTLEKPNDR